MTSPDPEEVAGRECIVIGDGHNVRIENFRVRGTGRRRRVRPTTVRAWAAKVALACLVTLLIINDPPRWVIIPAVFAALTLVDLARWPFH